MSYTPTTWTTGDTITATALNKIENGIANADGAFDAIVDISHTGNTSDPTVFTAVKGSYAVLYQMLESGHMPRMMVNYYDTITGIIGCSACISAYNWDADYISFYVMFWDFGVPRWVTEILVWEYDDTIHWA